MLNLIIGLFFVYLILSMLCSGIQEAIAGWIRLRGRMLLGAIQQMLSNQDKDKNLDHTLFDAFQDHQWFHSLKRSKLTMVQSMLPIKKFPSYIQKSTFTSILLQILGGSNSPEQIRNTVDSMNEGRLKDFLSNLISDAKGDAEALKTSIETWYDSTMHEVTLWYKTRSHTMLFVIGFLLASILNADTFSIYKKLSSNPETAEQIANLADAYVNSGRYQPIDTLRDDSTMVAQLDTLSQNLITIVNEDLASVYTPLGLGWHDSDVDLGNPYWWLIKLLGLLITTFAIAMGASFWFNLLKSLLSWRKSSAEAPPPPPSN